MTYRLTGKADPDDWVMDYRPRAIKRICYSAAAIVVAIHVVFAILLDMDYTGVSIRWLDKASLILLGLIIAAVICLPTQARLRVGPRGVGVKNWTSERVFPWGDVVGLAYPEKGQWAQLLLPGDEHVPVLAVQARDGDAAVDAMRDFRELQDRFREPRAPGAPKEPGSPRGQ